MSPWRRAPEAKVTVERHFQIPQLRRDTMADRTRQSYPRECKLISETTYEQLPSEGGKGNQSSSNPSRQTSRRSRRAKPDDSYGDTIGMSSRQTRSSRYRRNRPDYEPHNSSTPPPRTLSVQTRRDKNSFGLSSRPDANSSNPRPRYVDTRQAPNAAFVSPVRPKAPEGKPINSRDLADPHATSSGGRDSGITDVRLPHGWWQHDHGDIDPNSELGRELGKSDAAVGKWMEKSGL